MERRLEWAEARDKRASAALEGAHKLGSMVPLGQPILVGHHSEARHRRDLKRIDSKYRAAYESDKMATHHRAKADGLARQLDNTIFSDDENAIEALEARIAEREAQSAKMKAVNRAYAKGDAEALAELGFDLETTRAKLGAMSSYGKYYSERPFPSYALSNLRANIRRDKKRIEEVKRRAAATERAEAAGGITIYCGNEYCSVTFAEKPPRATLNELKAAGFRWGGGSWNGRSTAIPTSVLGMV